MIFSVPTLGDMLNGSPGARQSIVNLMEWIGDVRYAGSFPTNAFDLSAKPYPSVVTIPERPGEYDFIDVEYASEISLPEGYPIQSVNFWNWLLNLIYDEAHFRYIKQATKRLSCEVLHAAIADPASIGGEPVIPPPPVGLSRYVQIPSEGTVDEGKPTRNTTSASSPPQPQLFGVGDIIGPWMIKQMARMCLALNAVQFRPSHYRTRARSGQRYEFPPRSQNFEYWSNMINGVTVTSPSGIVTHFPGARGEYFDYDNYGNISYNPVGYNQWSAVQVNSVDYSSDPIYAINAYYDYLGLNTQWNADDQTNERYNGVGCSALEGEARVDISPIYRGARNTLADGSRIVLTGSVRPSYDYNGPVTTAMLKNLLGYTINSGGALVPVGLSAVGSEGQLLYIASYKQQWTLSDDPVMGAFSSSHFFSSSYATLVNSTALPLELYFMGPWDQVADLGGAGPRDTPWPNANMNAFYGDGGSPSVGYSLRDMRAVWYPKFKYTSVG